VTLYRYTEEGKRTIASAVEMSKLWRHQASLHGAQVHALYWLQGYYDAVTIVEAPDEDMVTAMLLAIVSEGSLHTETMSAYSADDLARILGKLADQGPARGGGR
jgi:uncharacterized protein with GYD domain